VQATLAEPIRAAAVRPEPAAPVIPALLGRLVAIEPARHRVVSCYLRLDPENRARRKYLVELKSRLRTAADERSAPDAARILRYLSEPRGLPPGGGLAIFACAELDLFEVVPLPRVHRTRVVVDDTPRVRELVAAEGAFGGFLALLLDRSHARFFHVTASGTTELPGLVVTSRRGGKFHSDRRDSPGWGEHDYHNRIREERHRTHAAVARQVEHLAGSLAPRGILLAGTPKEIAALRPFLPRTLADRIMGPARLNPTAATPDQVRAATIAAEAGRAEADAEALAASLADTVGTGWATNGAAETLRALGRGQVRTLVVRDDVELAGYRCSPDGRLAVARADCRGHGKPLPVRDVLDETVEEALRQHVEVVVLHGAAAEQVNALAAFLRFR